MTKFSELLPLIDMLGNKIELGDRAVHSCSYLIAVVQFEEEGYRRIIWPISEHRTFIPYYNTCGTFLRMYIKLPPDIKTDTQIKAFRSLYHPFRE
jgi:hypothetical protein